MNGADGSLPSNTNDWAKFTHPESVLVIDEANRAPTSSIQAAVLAAKKVGIPLCLTYNSSTPEGGLHDVVGNYCSYVRTEVPPFPIILSSMLACEGLQQADDLSERLVGLFEYLRVNCTRQIYYDWGLRKLKA